MAMRMSVSSRSLVVGTVLLGGAALVGVTARAPKAQANGWDHDHDHEPERYSIALWGDMPYNALGQAQYPALLADINARRRSSRSSTATSRRAATAPAPTTTSTRPAIALRHRWSGR